MGKLDNTPQPVREAIAVALMVAAITATAASLLHEPLFIPAGFILFLVFYFWKINPRVKAVYAAESQQVEARYEDDETYQPLLDRFAEDHDDDALIGAYRVWAQGPHDNEVRLRFLQQAILDMIDAGMIYRIEEFMDEAGRIASQEGLDERFNQFRTNCDLRISQIAKARLA